MPIALILSTRGPTNLFYIFGCFSSPLSLLVCGSHSQSFFDVILIKGQLEVKVNLLSFNTFVVGSVSGLRFRV